VDPRQAVPPADCPAAATKNDEQDARESVRVSEGRRCAERKTERLSHPLRPV